MRALVHDVKAADAADAVPRHGRRADVSAPVRQGGLLVGMNPYGLTYTLGLQGAGTARANPNGTGLDGFLAIATSHGARTIDLHHPWLARMDAAAKRALGERLAAMAVVPVVSTGLPQEAGCGMLDTAVAIGARVVRLGLTTILCGDRGACGAAHWPDLVAGVRARLAVLAPRAADLGLLLAIENHQDFGSDELLDLCEQAGHACGICLDTGNAFPVAEAPIPFARAVAPRVVHVHLKDYRVQFTTEGYRLVRCAIGDGAVPFAEIAAILTEGGRRLTAALEPGALEARHVRLFTPGWWRGYAPMDARRLAAALAAAQVNRLPEDADWRTPWEREAPPAEIVAYETEMMARSVANMRALGLME
jgi:sugar phosphate isomerase/epimerase